MNDLTTITREYTSMRSELERSKREVQDLKQQLQSYVDCVKRYEDELARKVIVSQMIPLFESTIFVLKPKILFIRAIF